MKLCQSCIHFQPSLNPSQCLHPGNHEVDYVNGAHRVKWQSAQAVRQDSALCDNAGRWFIEKQQKTAVA